MVIKTRLAIVERGEIMGGVNLFQGIFSLIDITLNNYVFQTAQTVINFTKPIFYNLMIIWIAIWGYLAMMGQTNEPLKEGLFRILRVGFIVALSFTATEYVDKVATFFTEGPEQIASLITGSAPGSIAKSLDLLYTKVFDITSVCWKKAGFFDGNFGFYLLGFTMMIIGTAFLLAVAFFVISAKIMTAVLLGVGPIFITLLLFRGTQRFFESWLSMLCNYGMILILTAGLGIIALDLANAFVVKMGVLDGATVADLLETGVGNLNSISMLIVVFGLTVLLMLQIPSVAAALGGGIALATQSVIGSTMNILRPSSIRRNAGHLQRDLRSVRDLGKKTNKTFQKVFGKRNTITPS